jgi:hypothetical protein
MFSNFFDQGVTICTEDLSFSHRRYGSANSPPQGAQLRFKPGTYPATGRRANTL